MASYHGVAVRGASYIEIQIVTIVYFQRSEPVRFPFRERRATVTESLEDEQARAQLGAGACAGKGAEVPGSPLPGRRGRCEGRSIAYRATGVPRRTHLTKIAWSLLGRVAVNARAPITVYYKFRSGFGATVTRHLTRHLT